MCQFYTQFLLFATSDGLGQTVADTKCGCSVRPQWLCQSKPEARGAYQTALAKLDAMKAPREANYRELLQMKLDAVGEK